MSIKFFFTTVLAISLSLNVFCQKTDTIPFIKTVGLMKVPVEINGKVYSFIFDTGAEISAIRADLVKSLGGTWLKSDTLYDAHNNKSIQDIYNVEKVKFGKHEYSDIQMLTFPNNPIFSCLEIDGIIGVNLIKKNSWIFDFDKDQIVIPNSNFSVIENNFTPMKFLIDGLRPKISLLIDNNKIDFLFDSGATVSDVDSATYNRIKASALKTTKQIIETSGALTVDKKSEGERLLSNTSFTSSNQIKYPAHFNLISAGENKIGNQFWNTNQVFLNWEKQQLAVNLSNNQLSKHFPLKFKIQGGNMIISSIASTKQIQDLEIDAGLQILSINGKVFTNNCDLKKYIDSFTGDEFSLELENKAIVTINKE